MIQFSTNFCLSVLITFSNISLSLSLSPTRTHTCIHTCTQYWFLFVFPIVWEVAQSNVLDISSKETTREIKKKGCGSIKKSKTEWIFDSFRLNLNCACFCNMRKAIILMLVVMNEGDNKMRNLIFLGKENLQKL